MLYQSNLPSAESPKESAIAEAVLVLSTAACAGTVAGTGAAAGADGGSSWELTTGGTSVSVPVDCDFNGSKSF